MLHAFKVFLIQWWIDHHDFSIKQSVYDGLGALPRDGFRTA